MLRRFLLPLLAVVLLATEAAQAQTTPAKASRQAYRKVYKAERVLTKREQQAAARVQAAREAAAATPAQASTTWSGWSDDPLPTTPVTAPGRAVGSNLSVAPGMPLNQLGHGVSTDYNGRPLARPVASTTLPNVR